MGLQFQCSCPCPAEIAPGINPSIIPEAVLQKPSTVTQQSSFNLPMPPKPSKKKGPGPTTPKQQQKGDIYSPHFLRFVSFLLEIQK
jgi:hypothetical protein